MILGTTAMNGLVAYSPTFPRGEENVLLSVDVIDVSAAVTLDIDVEHKNEADTTWASAGSFSQASAAGVITKDLSAVKEQLRFKYAVGGTNAEDWVHFLVMAPTWYP